MCDDLVEGVEPALHGVPVEAVGPIVAELAQVVLVGTKQPPRPGRLEPTGAVKALTQAGDHVLGDIDRGRLEHLFGHRTPNVLDRSVISTRSLGRAYPRARGPGESSV